MAEGGSFLNRGVGEPGRRAFLDLRREIQSVDDRLSAYVGFPNPFPDDVTFEGDVTVNEDLTVGGVVDASTFLGDLQGAVHVRVKNVSGVTLVKGSPVFATGSVGASGEVEVEASLAGTASTMPALGLLDESLVANGEGSATVLGVVGHVDTSLYAVNDELYVAPSGGLTNVRPSGASELVQKIGRVVRSDASTGEVLVLGAGRTNDVPNGLSPTTTLAGDASGSVTLTDLADGTLTVALSTPVITDHGGLGGLGDDDHPQYHDDARGDARYLQLSGGSLSGSLVVSGTVTVGAFTLPATDGLANQVLVTDGSGGVSWQNQAGGGGSPGGSDGQVQYNDGGSFGGASALYYDDVNSRVGIGTTSPAEELHILKDQDGDLTQVLIENLDQRVRIGSYYEAGVAQYGKIQSEQDAGGNVALALNPEGGNVGIGTTSPSHSLDVSGTVNASSYVRVGGEAGLFLSGSTIQVGSAASHMSLSLNAGAVDRLHIDSSGNVGIGDSTPSQKLQVAGNVTINDGSSANAFMAGSNYWRPQDVYGNSYFDINSGQFYVDSDTYYFRNRASQNSLTIDSSGSGVFTGNLTVSGEGYFNNWVRLNGGTRGLYSQSYGQHFYPDSGGFYWESDGPIRIRNGYNGSIQGYLGYHDTNGFGLLHTGGNWWLNTPNSDAFLVIGGSQALNAYNSTTSRRLMFGGGNSDAQGNYYIGTNMENYGGNYNKLDIFWHTGVRIAAMTNYGGIRMYGSIAGASLSNELFSVGKGDSHVRASNNMYAYAFRGHSNVAGTGEAVYAPAGVYSTGTNWLYGTIITNNYGINAGSGTISHGGGQFNGYKNQNNGYPLYHSDAPVWLRCGNNYGFSIGGWPGPSGGVANQIVWAYADATIYIRNWDNGGYAGLSGVLTNTSTRRIKKDIVDFKPASLSSAANKRYATDLVSQLRTVEYALDEANDGLSRIPEGMYEEDEDGNMVMNERKRKAYERLQSYSDRTGNPRYQQRHVCGTHCEGSVDDPCHLAINGLRRRPGLIAEEIYEVLPGAVDVNSSKQPESVDVMSLIGLLVAANQEMAERLDLLETGIY